MDLLSTVEYREKFGMIVPMVWNNAVPDFAFYICRSGELQAFLYDVFFNRHHTGLTRFVLSMAHWPGPPQDS